MSRYPDTPAGIAAANLWTTLERELGLVLSNAVSGCPTNGRERTAAYLVAQRLVRERDAEEELIHLARATGRDYELRRVKGHPHWSYAVDVWSYAVDVDVGGAVTLAYGATPGEAVREAQLLELS